MTAAGAKVLHGVDATALGKKLGNAKFDSIIFQFPHVGSREPVEGRNPNFILVRDFLKSAASHLTSSGIVMISAVDSPHYEGAFSFEEAEELSGFNEPEVYKFSPDDYSGYEHTMTHEEGDGLEGHKDFKTWVFTLK